MIVFFIVYLKNHMGAQQCAPEFIFVYLIESIAF